MNMDCRRVDCSLFDGHQTRHLRSQRAAEWRSIAMRNRRMSCWSLQFAINVKPVIPRRSAMTAMPHSICSWACGMPQPDLKWTVTDYRYREAILAPRDVHEKTGQGAGLIISTRQLIGQARQFDAVTPSWKRAPEGALIKFIASY